MPKQPKQPKQPHDGNLESRMLKEAERRMQSALDTLQGRYHGIDLQLNPIYSVNVPSVGNYGGLGFVWKAGENRFCGIAARTPKETHEEPSLELLIAWLIGREMATRKPDFRM